MLGEASRARGSRGLGGASGKRKAKGCYVLSGSLTKMIRYISRRISNLHTSSCKPRKNPPPVFCVAIRCRRVTLRRSLRGKYRCFRAVQRDELNASQARAFHAVRHAAPNYVIAKTIGFKCLPEVKSVAPLYRPSLKSSILTRSCSDYKDVCLKVDTFRNFSDENERQARGSMLIILLTVTCVFYSPLVGQV